MDAIQCNSSEDARSAEPESGREAEEQWRDGNTEVRETGEMKGGDTVE
jgi:hypothetical protein